MYQIKREMTINFHVFKIQKLSACIAYFYPMIVGFVLWGFFVGFFFGKGGGSKEIIVNYICILPT